MTAGQSRAQDVTAEDVARFRTAANQGDAAAQYNLGICYKNGWGVTRDYAEAARWYRKAAEQGLALAQNNLGICYEYGNGVAQNYYEAVKWYRKAAEQGLAEAQYCLGNLYDDGNGVTQDYYEAVKWFRKAAEQGYSMAQHNLGVCYEKGKGVTRDYAEAARWYRKAAEQGFALAQNNLGICYRNGLGVTQDYAEAARWYRKAAEQGLALAQYNLGVCYHNGKGVAQNYAEAVRLYRKAAEQGNAQAQYNLGVCYEKGEGVAQNDAEAVRWCRKAAEQGLVQAQYSLGGHYYNGSGVAKNYAEAKKWYSKACEQGNLLAALMLDMIAEEATEADDETFADVTTATVTSEPKGYAQFFPIYGVLPGKTTVSDVKALGYIAKSDGDDYKAYIQTLTFWDHDGDRVFKDIYMVNDDAMPDKWRELGLDWKLSYDEWLALFQRMGFSIEHTEAPETREYSGRNTLSAEFIATAPDQTFTMELDFSYGNEHGEGYSTHSKRSLYSISVKLKNKPSVFPVNDARALSVASVPAVRRYFSDFFPVYGVTIGRSTISDVEALDYAVEEEKYARVEGLAFWNHNGDRIFEDLYMTNDVPMPEKWQRLGLDWRLSYDDWLVLFEKMGFTIVHTRTPRTKHNALSAGFIATAPDGSFTMELDFMYGNKNGEGRRTSSRNSLYSITMDTE